jgi:hypothetical protein
MKQLVRATAVVIGVGIGIVSFGGVAHAWDESAGAQSACVGGVTSITVTFTNGEPSTGEHAMVVSAKDNQSDEAAIWGNGETEITVAGGDTVTGTINTNMVSASAGSVRITERWAHGSEDHDQVVEEYEARDCTPPPAFSATTQGSGVCDTTTGGATVDWSVTNTGEAGLRAVGTDLPGGTPNTLIPPGETLDMATLHQAGTFALAGYSVDVEATDGRTSTLHGTLTPALSGTCTAVIPQTETPVPPPIVLAETETPTAPPAAASTVKAATATLPSTGGAATPLTFAGLGLLGLGLLALGSTPTGAARLRRFAGAARLRVLR